MRRHGGIGDGLVQYGWPGNVRELENCAQGLLAAGPRDIIEADDLPGEIRDAAGACLAPGRPYLEEVERRAIMDMLEASGGNCAQAARLLGIAKTTVYRKIREYDIEIPSGGLQEELPGCSLERGG